MTKDDDFYFFDALEAEDCSEDLIPTKECEPPDLQEETQEEFISPLPKFPKGAELGTVPNCWSVPDPHKFMIRGEHYFEDGVKTPSKPYLFPARGVDVFLAEPGPENVGSNTQVLGGQLRDIPTLVINFRLPFGVCIFYHEIPSKFLPFLYKRYDVTAAEEIEELPSLDTMTPGDRAACRFLMGDDAEKREALKIVPMVAMGPWSVQQVVNGKPCIIGNYLDAKYVYQRKESEKAACLELDIDISGSWSARGILSVVMYATNELTLDLGFVVQANKEDELPEQMLTGIRLHRMDPFASSKLPIEEGIYPGT
mmetsp:Transcript_5504/g.8389  ORF Transcript_5504/g.8389 Transcript_5504/m.8389 type:complete len:311 (+) Transcript_5504:76-1008(+)|eukprot:CAMPEP_0195290398 /NCGR_PEP_ID=MMETSP0707-20130614/6281_1 /TAXON_ID=33640 /ORGANISM="Asterionellopsis glacialis, Strain CCMP134" /LENGTH=310 /DNA_ID=CAMNT_0040350525 /DNA_START=68 /DNA_END=1000 /DNA_ORIENTATION=+